MREAGERIAEALLDLVNGKKDLVQESLVLEKGVWGESRLDFESIVE